MITDYNEEVNNILIEIREQIDLIKKSNDPNFIPVANVKIKRCKVLLKCYKFELKNSKLENKETYNQVRIFILI